MKACKKIADFLLFAKKMADFSCCLCDWILIRFSFPLNSYLQDIRKIHTYNSGLISINFDQLIHFQADLPLIKVSFSAHEWNGFSAARSPEHKYPQMQKLKSVFKMIQFFQISLLSASSVTKAEKVVNIRNQLDVSMRMCKFLLVYMCLNFLLSISVCFWRLI